jgi:SAM-dependent methyltransferase
MTSGYIGKELDTFSHATNWKRYFSGILRPYICGDVLEVGAGNGSTTAALFNQEVTRWLCLEPDKALSDNIRAIPTIHCEILPLDLTSYKAPDRFDAVIYVDVLEHIENDRAELETACARLNDGGHLVVLAPAHQYLFSPFDTAIGHYRRYNIASLADVGPRGAEVVRCIYLDSMGFLLSLANRTLLKTSAPTMKQVMFWDRGIIPLSRMTDRLLRFRFGKSVLVVWRKTAAGQSAHTV